MRYIEFDYLALKKKRKKKKKKKKERCFDTSKTVTPMAELIFRNT
jgi:hypothetical protein